MQAVSSCPSCGAPIYGPKDWDKAGQPPVYYSCSCRHMINYMKHEHCYCRESNFGTGGITRICCKCGHQEPQGSLPWVHISHNTK